MIESCLVSAQGGSGGVRLQLSVPKRALNPCLRVSASPRLSSVYIRRLPPSIFTHFRTLTSLPPMSSTRPKPSFQLTPEQLALQAKRRQLKEKQEAERRIAAEANGGTIWPQGSEILVRPWVDVPLPPGEDHAMRGNAVKVMTWNVRDYFKSLYGSLMSRR